MCFFIRTKNLIYYPYKPCLIWILFFIISLRSGNKYTSSVSISTVQLSRLMSIQLGERRTDCKRTLSNRVPLSPSNYKTQKTTKSSLTVAITRNRVPNIRTNPNVTLQRNVRGISLVYHNNFIVNTYLSSTI